MTAFFRKTKVGNGLHFQFLGEPRYAALPHTLAARVYAQGLSALCAYAAPLFDGSKGVAIKNDDAYQDNGIQRKPEGETD